MYGRDLTLKEFWKLSEEERRKRYKDLSDHDKFGVRQGMLPGTRSIPCNDCIHYRGYARCDAYPEGISADHIQTVMDDQDASCGSEFKYKKKAD